MTSILQENDSKLIRITEHKLIEKMKLISDTYASVSSMLISQLRRSTKSGVVVKTMQSLSVQEIIDAVNYSNHLQPKVRNPE